MPAEDKKTAPACFTQVERLLTKCHDLRIKGSAAGNVLVQGMADDHVPISFLTPLLDPAHLDHGKGLHRDQWSLFHRLSELSRDQSIDW
jgi:hypothetical protein